MSDDKEKTLAERFVEALSKDGSSRNVVLRFPCGCVIKSGTESCAHVNALEARKQGEFWKRENDRYERKKKLEEKSS